MIVCSHLLVAIIFVYISNIIKRLKLYTSAKFEDFQAKLIQPKFIIKDNNDFLLIECQLGDQSKPQHIGLLSKKGYLELAKPGC